MKNENNIYGYLRVSSIERLGRDYGECETFSVK